MKEDLMITQQDLINWIDRPPSNDDLDLVNFISIRLKKFYELEQENKRLNNIIKECAENILKELEENHHLSYGVALSIRQKLLNYKELKEKDNE